MQKSHHIIWNSNAHNFTHVFHKEVSRVRTPYLADAQPQCQALPSFSNINIIIIIVIAENKMKLPPRESLNCTDYASVTYF